MPRSPLDIGHSLLDIGHSTRAVKYRISNKEFPMSKWLQSLGLVGPFGSFFLGCGDTFHEYGNQLVIFF
jgi:hypothetical protein